MADKAVDPSPAPPHGSLHPKFDTADFVVLLFCELIAIPLCHAGWDAVVSDHHTGRGLVALIVGLPVGLLGGSFHWWKSRVSFPTRVFVYRTAMVWLPAALFAAFVYVAGPQIYRRATEPVALTGAIGVMPIGTGAIPSPEPDGFRWDQVLHIENAFLQLPKPCMVKLTGTKGNFNARNILRLILILNSVCEIVDDQKDMSADQEPVDVDAPPPPKIAGLIVRWHESYAPAEKMFAMLSGNIKASKGHAMPPNSPENLIWIQVGDGYPWTK